MRVRHTVWLGLAALALVWPRVGNGQTIEDRIKILEDKIEERHQTAEQAIGIDMHFLGMFDYNYDFNSPPGGNIPLTTLTYKNNSFTVRDAAIFLGRNKDDEAFGFGFTLDVGDTANAIKARWGGTGPTSTEPAANENLCGNTGDCFVEIREVYLTYKTPLTVPTSGQPLSLKVGKFVTLLGYEVIPTYTNFNPNISSSISFGFGIPFTHTGILGHLPLSDAFALDVGVVNGWDNVADNNSGKTLLAGLGITLDPVVAYLSGTFGSEQDPINDSPFGPPKQTIFPGAGSQRGVISANATWKVIDQLSFALDGLWANESKLIQTGPGSFDSANWYGLVGYAIVQPMDKMQVALRGEWFDDPDGVRTGVGQTLWEVTPTFTYNVSDHLVFRTEYRHDESNKRYFSTGSGATVRGQDLVLTEGIIAF
jgi:hypothetical protein